MNPGRNKRMSSHHPIRQSTPREPQPRQFTLKTLILPFALLALLCGQASAAESNPPNALAHPQPASFSPLDLAPARWIWYPAERTLPNTVILFRRGLKLDAPPKSARGWILGESRYRLEVNGERVQWGPAPNVPRWPECDPVDLTHILKAGENVLGAAVLFYGRGSVAPIMKTTESRRSIAIQAREESTRISATELRLILAPISPGDTPEFSGVAAR